MERDQSKQEGFVTFSNLDNMTGVSLDPSGRVTFSSREPLEGFSDLGSGGGVTLFTSPDRYKVNNYAESPASPCGGQVKLVGSCDPACHQNAHGTAACELHKRRGKKVKKAMRNGAVDCCCNDTWVDYTAETSLHGFKYIWMRDIFLFRRLLWLMLTLACSAIMMYQILDRIIYFSNMPVTVDVRINFNTSLGFPSVTICNQNAFRASKAAELGIYDFLTDMYDDASPMSDQELLQYPASNISMDQLYRDTRHRLEDFIISCRWRGQNCGHDDFLLKPTDHGYCYTLDNSNLSVNSAGADDGLSLILNVEQYEYMAGPHDAAGVKILLHDKNEFPKVHALGQALSPGVHSFLAIRLVSVRNLPSPHGECDSPTLKNYNHYGTANCETECTANLLDKLCSCKLFYMPGDIPVCTVMQYYSCYLPNKNMLRQMAIDECYCPVPCAFMVFDPVVSYADASPLAVERFLAETNKTILGAKFEQARETTHRLQREKRQLFIRNVDDLEEKFLNLQTTTMNDIFAKLDKQREGMDRMDEDVQRVYNRTKYLFQYQKFITEKDFVRAADAMSERTFDVVAAGMQEFVHKMETKIQQLADPTLTDASVRKALYYITLNEIDGKVDIAQRALENYTLLYDSVLNGTPIFNYKFRSEPRHHSVHIAPLPLFQYALRRTRTIQFRSQKVGHDLNSIMSNLSIYREVAVEAFETGTINGTAMQWANVFFLRACREYLQSIDQFINDGLKYTVTVQEKRLAQFANDWERFADDRNSMYLQINTISSLAQKLEEGIFRMVKEGLRMSRDFLLDGRVMKRDIATMFLSEDMHVGKSDLRHFFAELRARGQEVYDLWVRLEKDSWAIYNKSLTDPNLQTYYDFKNEWSDVGNHFDAISLTLGRYNEYKAADIRMAIENNDDKFLNSLAVMMTDMRTFVDTGHINKNFIRTNFLRLNIFFRELNYEQITQQEAYDIFALLCDIGGSMGLFLGASVLTIFELLDLFIFRYGMKN